MRLSRSGLPDLIARPFAHRGLHGASRIENSRAAFSAAVAAGFGIELDIQGSADGEAFVFHDWTLDRLTDATGPAVARPAADLDGIRLKHGDETIPRLSEVLALIAGRTPLLIEIKARRGYAPPLGAIERALHGYSGAVALMSFDPWLVRRLPRRHPRGLVMTEEGRRGIGGRLGRHLALAAARPDFLAYDVRDLPSAFAARARARMPLLTWTVRDGRACLHADQIIFEGAAP